MPNHPPEPWKVDKEDGGIQAADGTWVADSVVGTACSDDPGAMPDGAQDRIVACVNACRGLPTEALNAGVIHEFIWSRLLGVRWDTCHPYGGIILPGDDVVDEAAAMLKKHGGGWEEYT